MIQELLRRHYFRLLLKSARQERELLRWDVVFNVVWLFAGRVGVSKLGPDGVAYFVVYVLSPRQRYMRIVSRWKTRAAAVQSAERLVRVTQRQIMRV